MLKICNQWKEEKAWMIVNGVDVEQEFPKKEQEIESIMKKYRLLHADEVVKILKVMMLKKF